MMTTMTPASPAISPDPTGRILTRAKIPAAARLNQAAARLNQAAERLNQAAAAQIKARPAQVHPEAAAVKSRPAMMDFKDF